MEGKKFCPLRKHMVVYRNDDEFASIISDSVEEFCYCIEDECMMYNSKTMSCRFSNYNNVPSIPAASKIRR